MKYFAAFLFILGFVIVSGAEARDWLPLFVAQVGLGSMTMLSGVLFAIHTGEDDE